MVRLPKSKTLIFFVGLVMVLTFAFAALQVDQAQAAGVSNKSLKGKYTMEHRTIGGSTPGAAVGYAIFDGAGKITDGRGFFSGDFGSGHEVLKVVKVDGTYNFNNQGIGTSTVTYYVNVGGVPTPVATVKSHAVITVRKKLSTYDQALEIYIVNDDLDMHGALDTFVLRKW